MALFTLDGCTEDVQQEHADEVCKHCGGWCTSSKECVEIESAADDDDPA